MGGQLAAGVKSIHSTKYAFAALKADGSVVAWGYKDDGGDCSKVQEQLAAGVQSLYSNEHAFAALKADGSVVAWGSKGSGGDCSKARATSRMVCNPYTAPMRAMIMALQL